MTNDEIIEMARQAGATEIGHKPPSCHFHLEELKAFAKLVKDDYSFTHAELWLKRIDEAVKAEREACAKTVEKIETYEKIEKACFKFAAKTIRARGEA